MGEEYSRGYHQGSNLRNNWFSYSGIALVVCVVKMVSEYFPTRTKVKWNLSEKGLVEIFLDKQFGKFEKMLAKFLTAPSEVRRTLDNMNSELWVLMDGSNSLSEIIMKMDRKFSERIAPVSERVSKSIAEFIELGLAVIVHDPKTIDWSVHPTSD